MEDKTLTKDEQNRKLKEQLEKQSGQKIDDEMLKVAANMQMVQPVALLPGGTKNNFIHVNMYVDDKGMSKGLRLNKRASDFTQLVNMPNQVAGDAFVAPYRSGEPYWSRFAMSLVSPCHFEAWHIVAGRQKVSPALPVRQHSALPRPGPWGRVLS